ncbi:unnamed protein product [Clonostachys rosea]|uniref:DFDF domain-containing protein n=1 Tax=Bionectria ochroleuca TaxID=29856 RepID=A0ABY6U6F5_BIOOC|nr:unnamed protein product [Clonostachys rosea]
MVVTLRVGAAAALVLSLASSVVALPDTTSGLEEYELLQRDLDEFVAARDVEYDLDERDFELYARDFLDLAPRVKPDGPDRSGPSKGPRPGGGPPRGGSRRRRGGPTRGDGPRRGGGPSRGGGPRGAGGPGRGKGPGGFKGMRKAGPPKSGRPEPVAVTGLVDSANLVDHPRLMMNRMGTQKLSRGMITLGCGA